MIFELSSLPEPWKTSVDHRLLVEMAFARGQPLRTESCTLIHSDGPSAGIKEGSAWKATMAGEGPRRFASYRAGPIVVRRSNNDRRQLAATSTSSHCHQHSVNPRADVFDGGSGREDLNLRPPGAEFKDPSNKE